MRRNIPRQGNHGQPVGPGAPATAPKTPRKDGAALNKLIRSIDAEWRLGLDIHNSLLSPSKRSDSLQGKVYGQIQRLFYSSQESLDRALDGFRLIAPGFTHDKLLNVLHGTLKSQTPSPLSKAGTPLSSQGTTVKAPLPTLKLCE
jgi:hypothetical protein